LYSDGYDEILSDLRRNKTLTLQDWEQKKQTLLSNRSHIYSLEELVVRSKIVLNIRTGWRNRKCLYEQVKAEKTTIARIMGIMLAKGELLSESSPHPTKPNDTATIYRLSKKLLDQFDLSPKADPSCRELAKSLGVSKNTINRLRKLNMSDYRIKKLIRDCPNTRYLDYAKKHDELHSNKQMDNMSIRDLSRLTGHSYSKIQKWLKSGKPKTEILMRIDPNQIGDGDTF